MALLLQPAADSRPLWFGALGGALASLPALALAAGLAAAGGQPPLAVLNGLGALWVRWLQTAAPAALASFFVDATLGGAAWALLLGALGGAVFGGLLARRPAANSLAWGLVLGAGLWAAARWALLPALDPVLGGLIGGWALAGPCVVYGGVLGLWQWAGADPSLPPAPGST